MAFSLVVVLVIFLHEGQLNYYIIIILYGLSFHFNFHFS